MWLIVLLALLGCSVAAAMAYLYWDFTQTPQSKWREQVLRLSAELDKRIRAEQRNFDNLAIQEKREQGNLMESHLSAALRRVPIEELRHYPGIGPGSITSLNAAGFSTVEDLRNRNIDISGFGDKRISDVRFAVSQIVDGHEKALADPQSSLALALQDRRKALHQKFQQSGAQFQADLERATQAQHELSKLRPTAVSVTFGKYLAKSLPDLVPAPYLHARLPDPNVIFRVRQGEHTRQETKSPPKQPAPAMRVFLPGPSSSSKSDLPMKVTQSRENVSPVFLGIGQRLEVAGWTLTDPLIYVADCARMDGFDASLLCLRRVIAAPAWEPPKALGYWPQLGEVKPHQVGNYLQWLAGGRQHPEMDLGYVFLFFYGLERRTLIDNADVDIIAQEIVRLLEVYNHSHSFCSYSTALLSHLIMLGRLRPDLALIDRMLQAQHGLISDEVKAVIVGYLAKATQPLPYSWALQFAETDERSRRSIVTKKCPDEFIRLFERKYAEKFGDGLIPQTDGRARSVTYKPASPSLLSGTSNFNKIPLANWPILNAWRTQFAPVIEIWNSCIDDLKKYARTTDSDGVLSAREFESLPVELKHEVQHPQQQEWENLLSEFLPPNGAILIPAGRIAAFGGVSSRARLTLAQSKSICDMAESLGTALEPDARYTGKSYPWDACIAVLRLPDLPVSSIGKNYQLAGIVLRLAVEISEADGITDAEERQIIVEFITERFLLGRNEQIRLSALIDVLLKERTSLAGLKKLLEDHLDDKQRHAIGRFLVSVAAQTNGISNSEFRALEKMYVNLGLSADLAQKDVAEAEYRPPESPIRVLDSEDENSVPLPGAVDLDRIRRLRAESDQVAQILVAAMTDTAVLDDDEVAKAVPVNVAVAGSKPIPEPPVLNTAQPTGPFVFLAASLRAFAAEFVLRDEWKKTEADTLARKHGTTLTAAIDGINEWADEHLGDFLVEDGDPVIVNRKLLNKE